MRRTGMAVTAGLMAVLTACGGGTGSSAGTAKTSTPPSASATTPSPTATQTAGTGTAAGASVSVASTSVGQVLVDARGMTLYVFDPDHQGPSTCYDACATAWPPLTVTAAPVAGQGVDASQLSVVARKDGRQQVTYHGWPLYLWQKDVAPGDVTGQAVKGVWWVLDPSGTPVRR